jgi:diguanylate cyclase (GGDEF)-like protein/PAS domain S-box-containing protein
MVMRIATRINLHIPKRYQFLYRHLVAVALVTLALLVRLAIAPVDAGLPYVTFFPAVTLSVLFGGFTSGLLATLIGIALSTYFFIPPYYAYSIEGWHNSLWSNLVFLFDGIIVSFSIETMFRYREKYQKELYQSEKAKNDVITLNRELSGYFAESRVTTQDLLKFEAIIDSTDDAVISKSLSGTIQSWNRGAENIFGYTATEAIGKPAEFLIPFDRLNEEAENFSRILRGERVEHFETVHQCKDGRLINISATLSPVIDLQGKVVGISKIARNITERKKMEGQVHQLAFYDTLTNLPNRRLLNDRLGQMIAASKRSGCYGALMFLDLDNFKPLNDMHGHVVGDLLLIEAADRLKSCVREMDTVARFGGDEFVVMISDLSADKTESTTLARNVAETISKCLSTPYLLSINHEGTEDTTLEYHCTASIGAVVYINHVGNQDDILKWADAAMYQAKEAGRNKIRFYDEIILEVETG